jgi:acyl-CoA synthetase (AMP-forming)/AMP-acid ligase II
MEHRGCPVSNDAPSWLLGQGQDRACGVIGSCPVAITLAADATFKWPERLEIIAELPATKVGKIDKKALREDIARRLTAV